MHWTRLQGYCANICQCRNTSSLCKTIQKLQVARFRSSSWESLAWSGCMKGRGCNGLTMYRKLFRYGECMFVSRHLTKYPSLKSLHCWEYAIYHCSKCSLWRLAWSLKGRYLWFEVTLHIPNFPRLSIICLFSLKDTYNVDTVDEYIPSYVYSTMRGSMQVGIEGTQPSRRLRDIKVQDG